MTKTKQETEPKPSTRFRRIVTGSSHLCFVIALSGAAAVAALPPDYQGRPFADAVYKAGPQVIPGRVECAYFDLGGEGVAYHDTDASNNGNGVLNQQANHQRPHATPYHWNFRTNEGVDLSYTKDFADFAHNQNLVSPPTNQFYIGWTENGESCNYTVNVQKAGAYKIIALYGNATNTFQFSINRRLASECQFPVHTGSMHKWNKAQVGTITFLEAGTQLLTLHYNKGNNFAYFDFEPDVAEISGAPNNGSTVAADWPQWRGPNRDGIALETNLARKWPQEGPPVLFTLSDLGTGWASPAVVGKRLYIPGKHKEGLSIVAFDLDSRRQLWRTVFGGGGGFPTFPAEAERQKQIGNTEIGSTGGGANATPVVEGNRLYIMGPEGDVAALDTESGKILWSKNLVREFHSNLQLGHYGYSEAPLIDGEKLIITPGMPDCLMVAIHKESGQILWQAKYPPFGDKGEDKTAYSSCVVSEAGGIRQYVNLTGRGLVGVAAADGKFLWGYNRIANRHTNIPTPVVRGDNVFCSNGYSTGTVLLKLSRDGRGGIKCEEVYFLDFRTAENQCGQYVLLGDFIYMASGMYTGTPMCIEWTTGKIVWKADGRLGRGAVSVIAADGMLILRSESHDVLLVEATPSGYHPISQFKESIGRVPGSAHPVVAGGCLYLRDRDTLTCYDLNRQP